MKLDMSKAVFCGLALIAAAMFLYVGLEAKPAQAAYKPWQKCFVDRMEDAHTKLSAQILIAYCQGKYK